MTDTELDIIYSEFIDYFNNNVPDMEHEPIRFHYFVNLFLYSRRK